MSQLVDDLKRVGRVAAEQSVKPDTNVIDRAVCAQYAVNCFMLAKMMQDGDDQ